MPTAYYSILTGQMLFLTPNKHFQSTEANSVSEREQKKTRMWADAQRDGRTAEYRWRHLFNTAKFG